MSSSSSNRHGEWPLDAKVKPDHDICHDKLSILKCSHVNRYPPSAPSCSCFSIYHCYLLKVYIGDLGSDATRYELEDAFNPFGTVKNVWIAKRPPGRNMQLFITNICSCLNLSRICLHSDGGRQGCRGRREGAGRDEALREASEGRPQVEGRD